MRFDHLVRARILAAAMLAGALAPAHAQGTCQLPGFTNEWGPEQPPARAPVAGPLRPAAAP